MTKENIATKKKSPVIPILMVLCAVSIVVMVIALLNPKVEQAPFTPPPFEENAVMGEPTVPEGLGWSQLYQTGMSFRAWLCGNLTVEGNEGTVYLYNPSENEAWLKMRLYDEAGNLLAESGLLKPGEHLPTLHFDEPPAGGTTVIIKLMAYEPETYHSLGAVSLQTKIAE